MITSNVQAHTVPLEEGVPPISDKGSVEVYKIGPCKGYGRVMEFTDEVDWKIVDPVIAHYTNEYSIVAVETLDLLAQDMLLTVAQKYFAGGAASQDLVTIVAGAPSMADFRLIGLALKKAKVKPVDATFHVLVSPEFVYDMLDDPYVMNYMKINQNASALYEDQALPNMFGFSFHEVNNCPTTSAFVESNTWKCIAYKLKGSATAGTGEWTDGTYLYKKVAADNALVSGYVKDARTGKDASYIPNQRKFTPGSGWTILKQNHIIILGKDALVRTGMSGEDTAKMYVKPVGTSGVLDPLDKPICQTCREAA